MEKIKNWLYWVGLIGSISFVQLAHAQLKVPGPGGLTALPPPPITNTKDIEGLALGITLWIFWGLIVFSIVMVLVGGYRYLTSAGDAEKVKKANKTLIYAAIAVAVALIAAGVPLIVSSFLGG